MLSVSNKIGVSAADVEKRKHSLFDVVGILPATERTPDIFYCNDLRSEKVAGLTFLSLWFLPSPIQSLLRERASAVICGLSPLSGGLRLEKLFNRARAGVPAVSRRMDELNPHSTGTTYAGRCYQPEWGDHGDISKKGFLAIYATHIGNDEARLLSERWQGRLRRQWDGVEVPPEDDFYQPIWDKPHTSCVHKLADIFALNVAERDAALAEMLGIELTEDEDSLYDLVPRIVGHEVGHILHVGTGLNATCEIEDEIRQNISRKAKAYKYFKDPREAVAELAGIVFLRMIQRNAGIDFGLPNSMLDEVLPNSYDAIEKEVGLLCKAPTP